VGIAIVIVVVAVVVVLLAFFVFSYNGLVRARNRVDNAWAQVDVQLKRRYDLVPNLVETVKGYASHERDTLDAVIRARNQAQAAGTIEEQVGAENVLSSALRQLFALSEAYPELRASEQFGALQAELSETENRIAISRQIHNDTVLTYNNRVETIPTNIVASLTGFETRPHFDFGPAIDEAPDVSF
jgi:LemA protein